jgi:hypothetical protein
LGAFFIEKSDPMNPTLKTSRRRKRDEQYRNSWHIRHQHEDDHGRRGDGRAPLRQEQLRRSLDVPAVLQGELLAHVRIFTMGDNDTMRPTKQGIAIKLNDVPKLAEAVTALVRAVKEQES